MKMFKDRRMVGQTMDGQTMDDARLIAISSEPFGWRIKTKDAK